MENGHVTDLDAVLIVFCGSQLAVCARGSPWRTAGPPPRLSLIVDVLASTPKSNLGGGPLTKVIVYTYI